MVMILLLAVSVRILHMTIAIEFALVVVIAIFTLATMMDARHISMLILFILCICVPHFIVWLLMFFDAAAVFLFLLLSFLLLFLMMFLLVFAMMLVTLLLFVLILKFLISFSGSQIHSYDLLLLG